MNPRPILIVAAVAVFALSACSGTGAAVNDQDAPASVTPTASATSEVEPEVVETPVVEEAVEEPTPEPEPTGPDRVALGEATTITSDGEAYLDITVSKASQHKSYGSGYLRDKPKKGNVFLQTYVTYTALQDGATYNQFDWNVFVDGVAVDNWAFASEGPDPDLGSGELPKGRKAKGWLLYEVPAKGEVLLSYGGSFTNDAPIFEVVLRKA